MGKLEFTELPQDVKRIVVGYIKRPTDLKNLCLTCKELRELATPQLYRSIQLLIGGPQDMRLSAMLNPNNPGLKHIRKIYLRLENMMVPRKSNIADDDSDAGDELVDSSIRAQFAQLAAKLLLDWLPPDILECFNWQPWDPLSNENFILLCKKQKTLHDLDIGPMTRALEPDLDKEPGLFENLTCLKRIDLYPDSIDRLNAAHRLIKAHPKIETFHLCTGWEYNPRESHPDDLQDLSTGPGRITSTLFSHMLPFEDCTPYTLKSLILDDIELRYAQDTWMKVFNFQVLEKLVIIRCAGAETVFAQLSKPQNRPTRLKILRWMDDDKSQPHTLDAFDGFLAAFSSLEVLSVWIGHMTALPKVSAICSHRRTLTSLAVQSRERRDDVHTYSEDDYRRLCTECQELRQLSVMFPDCSADASVWSLDFRTFVDITKRLHHLVTLNIRRWPSQREFFVRPAKAAQPTLQLYELLLQRMTQRIFEGSDADAAEHGYGLGHRSHLALVAWGQPGKTPRDDRDKMRLKQIPFVRGTQTDAFGKTSLLAVKTLWRLMHFIEPESDMLQHSLYDLYEPDEGLAVTL